MSTSATGVRLTFSYQVKNTTPGQDTEAQILFTAGGKVLGFSNQVVVTKNVTNV